MMRDLKISMFRSNYELHKASGSNIFVCHSGVLKKRSLRERSFSRKGVHAPSPRYTTELILFPLIKTWRKGLILHMIAHYLPVVSPLGLGSNRR